MTIVLGILAAFVAFVILGALIALPAIAIAHFGKTDYVPAGVTAHEFDHTVWPLYGVDTIVDIPPGLHNVTMNINDFIAPDVEENPMRRAIREQAQRLGREE